jgi:hypothetical protein
LARAKGITSLIAPLLNTVSRSGLGCVWSFCSFIKGAFLWLFVGLFLFIGALYPIGLKSEVWVPG